MSFYFALILVFILSPHARANHTLMTCEAIVSSTQLMSSQKSLFESYRALLEKFVGTLITINDLRHMLQSEDYFTLVEQGESSKSILKEAFHLLRERSADFSKTDLRQVIEKTVLSLDTSARQSHKDQVLHKGVQLAIADFKPFDVGGDVRYVAFLDAIRALTVIVGPNNNILISIWDTEQRKVVSSLKIEKLRITSVTLSADKSRLAIADSAYDIHFFKVGVSLEREKLKLQSGHDATIVYLLFLSDRKHLLISSVNGISLHHIRKQERVCSFPTQESASLLRLTPDEKTLIALYTNYSLAFWNLKTDKGVGGDVSDSHRMSIRNFVSSPDGSTAVSIGWDSRVLLWDVKTGKVLRKFSGTVVNEIELGNSFVQFSKDGNQVYIASEDRESLRVWDTKSGELIRTMSVQRMDHMATDPAERFFVTTYFGENFLIWRNKEDPEVLAKVGGFFHVYDDRGYRDGAFELSSDGKTLIVGNRDGLVRFIHINLFNLFGE